MNAVIVDVESNGKPKNFKASMKDVDNWCRVAQLAFQKVSIETGQVLQEYETMIKPDGWTIPTVEELQAAGEKNPYFFVENNMSTERCEFDGIPITEALSVLIDALNDSEYVVAHNLNFDYNVIGAEMIRANMRADKRMKQICTMEAATDYCKLPGRYGNYKWPSLMETHVKLFDCEFTGNHDALDDVRACAKCLLELIRLQVINIQHLLL